MSEHLDTWVKARALIAEERHWCQGATARTAAGFQRMCPMSEDVVARCLGGAMVAAAGGMDAGRAAWIALQNAAAPEIAQGFPGGWNDTHSHSEVLSLLDRGIASARASRSLPGVIESALDVPAPSIVEEQFLYPAISHNEIP
jgi:hypothetical protein